MYTITDKLCELVIDYCGKVQYDFTQKDKLLVSIYLMRGVDVNKPNWLFGSFRITLKQKNSATDFNNTCQALEKQLRKLLLMSNKELDAHIPSKL